MTLFKNFKFSFKSLAKIVGGVFVGLILIAVAIPLIKFSFETINDLMPSRYAVSNVATRSNGGGAFFGNSASFASPQAGYDNYTEEGFALGEADEGSILPPQGDFSPGPDAEDFEQKSYNATIKTRKLEKTCQQISDLKAKDYVIFEEANQNENYCYYRFKVDKANYTEILAVIEALNPENLNENIRTIKRQVEDVETELDILQKKLEAVEETLQDAQTSYDVIASFATNQQNVEALAKIVDDKLRAIERLTSERLNLKNQIDRTNRNQAENLDRLAYIYFDVSVQKDVVFDWKNIKNDWKYAVKKLVMDFNESLKLISVYLIRFLLYLTIGILYLFLIVFLLKFVWRGVKRIWTHGNDRRK